jgi:hypothetical protein
MKEAVLLELANRWEQDAKEPDYIIDGSEETKLSNAIQKGERRTKRECADHLRMLVQLLGEK